MNKKIGRILILTFIVLQLGFNIILLQTNRELKKTNQDFKNNAWLKHPHIALDYILENKSDRLFSYLQSRIEEASEHLEIKQLNNTNYWRLFLKENYLDNRKNILTWHDFHKAVMNYFYSMESDLEKEWGLKGQILQAAFFVGIVKHLFPFGHEIIEPNFPGCASEYDATRHINNGWVPIKHFLYETPVGCCEDYARFLYMLMNLSGIEAKHVLPTGGHVLIEAVIDGQLYTFDPSYGFFSPYSVKSLFQRNSLLGTKSNEKNKKVIYVLPIADFDPNSKFYRSHRARRAMLMLLTSGTLNLIPQYAPGKDTMKEMFIYNGILSE